MKKTVTGLKQPKREVNNLNTKLKNEWVYTFCPPYAFTARSSVGGLTLLLNFATNKFVNLFLQSR